jgi:YD repeat-containing protein
MPLLRRFRQVDANNSGFDKTVVQIDPVDDFYAELFIPVGVDGSPVGTATNPLRSLAVDQYSQQFDYDTNGNLLYHGVAEPGTATSAAAWQIKQFTYDGSSRLTAVLYAGGSVALTSVWDNRASLTYS